jgi:ChrR Cupin-like domain
MIEKEHKEFHALDLGAGWHVPAGYPPGIEQKILAGHLDEANRKGSRTRLLRFQPGVFTTKPFVHEYWEEVYLISGDLIVGNTVDNEEKFAANTYACRPPGVYHGPFKSVTGCLLLEIHYFDQA